MNRIYIKIVFVALVGVLFTSAFSGISVIRDKPDCNIVMLLTTIFTNTEPCGFSKSEVVNLISSYVSDIVHEITEPSSIAVTANTIDAAMPTLEGTTTPTQIIVQATNTLTRPQAVHTKNASSVVSSRYPFPTATRINPTNTVVVSSSTETIVPTSTSTPFPTDTSKPSTNTPEPTPTIELPQETNTPEPTATLEESSIVDTSTPEE